MDSRAQRFLILALAVLSSSFLLAEEIPNWTVPPYGGARPTGELSTMTDTSPGVAFVAMSPCRVFDTRNANGPYGGPRLVANVTRNFDIDSGPCTGIPAGVDAYSMNFGAILADGIGFVTIWPTGVSQPTVSSINTIPGYVLANAAVVPAGTNGSISVFPNTGMHLYGDINGYFTDRYNPGVSFHAVSTNVAPAILAENTSTDTNASAVQAVITSTSAGDFATAVYARTNGNGYGVHGSSANGYGVLAGGGAGGVYATTDGAGVSGVYGQATATTGNGKGVYGRTQSPLSNAAGVFGVTSNDTPGAGFAADKAGVRGESASGHGVLGLTTTNSAVAGWLNPTGAPFAFGCLACTQGGSIYGVYSFGNTHVAGTFTATTNKGFVQPHPHDASKEIRYISLEGPHTEVYFRGTAQVSQGVTRIPIPEHFRFVADPATYSTLVTPVGGMATVAVLAEGPEGIVVQASRNVKVHYVVYAEREAVRNPDPIIENVHFRPDPDRDFLAHLPDTFRQLMIQNGTLNSDGTINMETARRLGWDKDWEKREKPAPQPTPE